MNRTALLRPLALTAIGLAVLSGCAVDVAPVAAPVPAPAAVSPAAAPTGSGRSAPGGMGTSMQGGTRSGGRPPVTGAMRAPGGGASGDTITADAIAAEISRVTQEAVGVTPTDISCPAEVPAAAGTTFTCTAAVEGQPVTYHSTLTDDDGSVDIDYTRMFRTASVEEVLVSSIANQEGVDVAADCTNTTGHTVVVNAPGEVIDCVVGTLTTPPTYAPVAVTVDADGTLSYTVGTAQTT